MIACPKVGEVDMMKNRRQKVSQGNLSTRRLPFCIGITVMVLAIATGFARAAEKEPVLDDFDKLAVRELQSVAAVTGQLLNVYMDARITDMLVAATVNERLKMGLTTPEARGDANRILEAWLKTSGAYDAILLVDKTGACVAAAPAGLMNLDFSQDQAFKGAIGGRLTLQDLHKSDDLVSLDPKSKGWTVTIAVPVKDQNAQAGVLMSFLKWSHVKQLVESVKVGRTGYVFVLNKQNQVIIHPSEQFFGMSIRDVPINLPALDEAITRRVPCFAYDYENVRLKGRDTKLVGLAYPKGGGNFQGLDWTVAASADRWDMWGEPSFSKGLWKVLFFR
jgi:methyl-accepting chemotaxis protein